MKTIYFIRHAKSEQNIACDDIDRPLNGRGEGDAPFMGERLKRYKVKPDIIISSPAKRAFSTAKIIAERLEVANLKTEPKLYTGTSAVYLDIITQISDEYKSVFIVGHNPTITEICENLSGKFVGNIPTCGIFCIEFDVECFSDISSSSGKKLFFDFPKKHKIFV